MKHFEELVADLRTRRPPDPLTRLEMIEREVSDLVAEVRRGRFVQDDGCLLGDVLEHGNQMIEAIATLHGAGE